MKLTKSQFKDLLKEEIKNIFEDGGEKLTPDVTQIGKRLETSGIAERVTNLVNTPKELLEMLDMVLSLIEMRPASELVGLKKFVSQYSQQITGGGAEDKPESPVEPLTQLELPR